MKKQVSHKIVSLVFVIIVVCFAIAFYVVAWDEPTQVPPGCPSGQPGCDAPINVSNAPQIKSGSLRLGGLTVDNDTYLVTSAGNVGIGTTSPGAKLDVVGDVGGVSIQATGDICTDAGGGVCLSVGGGGVPLAPVIGYNYLTSDSNTLSGTYQDCITVSVNLPAGSTYTIMAWGYVGNTGGEGARGRIRLVIDGTGVCENDHQTSFRGSSALIGRRTGVASGARTVKIQQKNLVNGSFIDWRSLLVMAIAE